MAAGELAVWGDNSKNQISSRPRLKDFKRIVPGGAAQTLALRDNGSLAIWGDGDVAIPIPIGTAALKVKDASASVTHIVVILDDEVLFANGTYPVKTGVTPPQSPVIPQMPSGKFRSVAVGGSFGVAIGEDYKLQHWGTISPPPGGEFVEVRARNNYAIALSRETGNLYGWGGELFEKQALSNFYLLSAGWQRDDNNFLYTTGPFTDLAAGIRQEDHVHKVPHILAIKGGTVHGWGANNFDELTPNPGSPQFKQVAAGNGFSIGLAVDGSLHHWGRRVVFRDRLNASPSHFMLDDCPAGRFMSIGAGPHHAAAVRDHD